MQARSPHMNAQVDPPGLSPLIPDDPNKINRVLGAKLFHDVIPMDLHGPLADAKYSCGLLVGGGCRNLKEHFPFARRQQLVAGEAPLRRGGLLAGICRWRAHNSTELRTRETIASATNRLSMKSKAPLRMASTTLGISFALTA